MIWPMVNIKNLTKRRESDKFFREKAFTIASNPKYDVCQRGLASMVHRNFDKKSTDSDIKSKIMTNQQLPEELHKPINRKFIRRSVYSSFKDNIWGADLIHIKLINKYSKGIRFLLGVLDLFSKYAWVVLLKHKKYIAIVNAK